MSERVIASIGVALRRGFRAALWLALLWAIANCLYVYLVLGGRRSYRIESSLWLLIGLLAPLVIVGKHDIDELGVLALPEHQRALLLVLVVGLWLMTFVPHITFPFLSDDFVFLDVYQQPRELLRSAEFFRPLFALVFWSLAQLGQGSPIPFHIVSMLLHLMSACILYAFASRFFGGSTVALICFTVFLLNPLQLEATLWVAGLQEVLWTFFVVSAAWYYVRVQVLSVQTIFVTAVLVAAALLSKETAISFALLLPAADLVLYRLRRGPLLGLAYLAFAVIVAAYLLVRQNFAAVHSSFLTVPSRYFVKQLVAVPYAFFAQPWNATAVHVPGIISCLLSVLLITLLFIRVVIRGASRQLLVGPAVVLISTLPVYSFFFVSAELVAARYIYFAAVGWAVLMAQLLGAIRSRVILALAIGTLAVTSFVWLRFNLRPWNVAEDVVVAMRAGAARDEAPADTIAKWTRERGVAPSLKDGVPYSYQGVGIFINGYPEFRRIVGARMTSPR